MKLINHFYSEIELWIQRFGIVVLQLALGLTSFWLGWLKVAGRSPMMPVLHVAFPQYDIERVLQVVGSAEGVIGVGLLLPIVALPRGVGSVCVRIAMTLLFLELLVIAGIALFSSAVMFQPAFPFLTVVGEYLARYVVFVVSGIVILAHVRGPQIHDANA